MLTLMLTIKYDTITVRHLLSVAHSLKFRLWVTKFIKLPSCWNRIWLRRLLSLRTEHSPDQVIADSACYCGMLYGFSAYVG